MNKKFLETILEYHPSGSSLRPLRAIVHFSLALLVIAFFSLSIAHPAFAEGAGPGQPGPAYRWDFVVPPAGPYYGPRNLRPLVDTAPNYYEQVLPPHQNAADWDPLIAGPDGVSIPSLGNGYVLLPGPAEGLNVAENDIR